MPQCCRQGYCDLLTFNTVIVHEKILTMQPKIDEMVLATRIDACYSNLSTRMTTLFHGCAATVPVIIDIATKSELEMHIKSLRMIILVGTTGRISIIDKLLNI